MKIQASFDTAILLQVTDDVRITPLSATTQYRAAAPAKQDSQAE